MAMKNLRQRPKTRKHARRNRRLMTEALENRQLLAADLEVPVDNVYHNYRSAADVNGNGAVTAADALALVNRLGKGDLDSALVDGFQADVNNDGQFSPSDAIAVVNRLNRGEGETLVLGLKLDITQDGVSLLRDTNGAVTGRNANISVGDKFDLEVLVDDLRGPFSSTGAFTVYADIFASDTSAFRPVLSETQVVEVSENLVDGTGGNIVLSAPGRGSATISFIDFATNQEGSLQAALENDLGYGAGNISVFQGARIPRDGATPGDPFTYFIRYNGDSEEFVDVPNVTLDTSGISGATVTSTTTEVPVFVNNDPGQINPNAFRFNIDFRSSSLNDAIVYANAPAGNFDPNGTDVFDDVGGTGPVDAGGIRAFATSQGGTFSPTDFEAFSIEIEAVSATSNLTFSLNLPDDSGNELTVYGIDTALTPMEIEIDTNDTPGVPDDGQGVVVLNFVEGVSAVDDNIVVNEGVVGNVNVLLNDTDNTGGTLSAALDTGAANGTVTFEGGVATYTPATDFFGSDSFTYTATSTNGGTATATVNVTVNSVNDDPTANPDTIGPTNEGVAFQFAGSELIANDSAGPANEGETVSLQSVATTSANGGTIVGDGAGNYTYTPAAGFSGTDTFTYTIQDSNAIPASDTGTVTINVTDVPSPPVAGSDTISAVEDVAFQGSIQDLLLANDSDPDGDQTISFQSFGSSNVVNNGDGTFTYTPPADEFGTAADSFTYTISDNTNLTAEGTVNVNISGVNDAPMAISDSLPVDEASTGTALDVLLNDSAGPNESDSLVVDSVGTATAGGTVSITPGGGSITYTPPSNTFLGTDTFTYTIRDSEGLTSNQATVTVSVVPTVRPRAINDSVTTNENSPADFNVLTNDLANDGEQVVFVSFDDSTIANGSLEGTGGNFTYTPNTDFFGTETFTYAINDTSGGTPDPVASVGTVTITVNSVNNPPTFVADSIFEISEDSSLNVNGNATSNDSAGPANENQTVSIVGVDASSPQNGTVVEDGGVITYTPAANFFGTDTFTYTISDGVDTASATATVSVTSVNDAPTAVDQNVTGSEDDPLVISGLLNGATGGPSNESQTVTLSSFDSASLQGGTVVDNGDGTFTYTPVTDFFGDDSFTFTVVDDEGLTATATINIDVVPDNPLPIANDDSVSAFVGVPLTIETSELLANDSDPADEAINFVSVAGPNVVDNGDGTLTYTAPAGITSDTFTYTITDGTSNVSATVNVTIAEFQPSSVEGQLYIDQTVGGAKNGAFDQGETALGGVMVYLSGTSSSGAAVAESVPTNANGGYRFEGITPGQYTVTFDMPGGVIDDTSNDDSFDLTIGPAGGVDATAADFTFAAFDPVGTMLDWFSHSYLRAHPELSVTDPQIGNEGVVANFAGDGTLHYVDVRDGFGSADRVEVALNEDQVTLILTDANGDRSVAAVPSNRALVMDNQDGGHLVRIFGDITDFTFVAV